MTWHSLEPEPSERAQSEVVGVTLLVGVFALFAIIVGVVVIGSVSDQADDGPLVELNVSATYTDLVLVHEGGDNLDASAVTVIVRQDGEEWRYGLDSFAESSGTDPSQFAGGERWNRSHDLAVDQARLSITHEPSNTVLYEERLAVPPETNERPTARFDYAPSKPGTGEQVTFDASASSDPDGTVANYTWTFGDGTTTETADPVVNHTYLSPGEYEARVRVTDDDGATRTKTKTLLVNSPPSAAVTVDCTEQDCTFNAGGSTDDGAIANYTWAFGDGNTTTTTDPVVEHTYPDGGSYDLTLTVTDEFGATDTATSTVEINDPPTAAFTYTPDQPQAGEQITFDASASSDPNGVIASYEWDFDGDGTTDATGETVTHTYSDGGQYTATLTVTDDDSVTNATTVTIDVRDSPSAAFTYTPSKPTPSETITFDGSNSTSDGSIASYEWDFDGDGVTDATGQQVTHAYTTAGSYNVTMTVIDGIGASDTTRKSVTVSEPPTESFTYQPTVPETGESFTVDASGSSDPDGSIASYEWDFDGDGATDATGRQATHVYDDGGAHDVTLTVTDDTGRTASSTRTIEINAPPVANYTYTRNGNEVTLNASSSYDPDSTDFVWQYRWDIDGDGEYEITNYLSPTTTVEISNQSKPSNITLSVSDGDGLSNTTTRQLPYSVEVSSPGFGAAVVVVAVLVGGWLRRRRGE